MDKRYQVFVSSTFVDLQAERQEVIRTLLELDCIPSGMELFPASDQDAWSLIKSVIDQSDFYLVILAGRYGSTHPETGISYTEMEFDYAAHSGIPIFGFVHSAPDEIPLGLSETEIARKEKLTKFREKVDLRHSKRWSSTDELCGGIAQAIVRAQRYNPQGGWIRADEAERLMARYEALVQIFLEKTGREQAGSTEPPSGFGEAAAPFDAHDKDREMFTNKSTEKQRRKVEELLDKMSFVLRSTGLT